MACPSPVSVRFVCPFQIKHSSVGGGGEGACGEACRPRGPVVSASPVVLQPCTGVKIGGKPQGAPAGLSSQRRGVLI